MQAKVLKNIIYKGKIYYAGEMADLDEVTYYVMEKRGNVSGDKASLPTFDEVVAKKKK